MKIKKEKKMRKRQVASGEKRRKREGSFPRGIRFGGERRKNEERKIGERKEKEKTR